MTKEPGFSHIQLGLVYQTTNNENIEIWYGVQDVFFRAHWTKYHAVDIRMMKNLEVEIRR